MATGSSNQLKLVPEKLKSCLIEQDEEYSSSKETDDVFVSGKCWKQWNQRNASLSRASYDGIPWCFYLAMIAMFASASACIELYGSHHIQCRINKDLFSSLENTIPTLVIQFNYRKQKKRSLVYAEVEPEIKIKFLQFWSGI